MFTNAIPTAHGKKYGIENAFSRSTGRPRTRNVAYVLHGTTMAAMRVQTGTRTKSDAFAATPASNDTPTKKPVTVPEKRKLIPCTGPETNHSAPISLRSELGTTIDAMYRVHPTLGRSGGWRREREAIAFMRGLTVKLRGRPEALIEQPQAVHGPLQRLLGGIDISHRNKQ